MKDLGAYLQKFRQLISSNEDKTKIVSEEILKITNIYVPENQIIIKEGIITINTKPVIKSEFFINKEKIIKAIQERGISNIRDLR